MAITPVSVLRFVDKAQSIYGSGSVLLDINDGTKYVLDEIEYPKPPPRIEHREPAHKDGREVSRYNWENREVTIRMHVFGANESELYDNIHALEAMFLSDSPILEWRAERASDYVCFDLLSPPTEQGTENWFKTWIRKQVEQYTLASLEIIVEAKPGLRGRRQYSDILNNLAPNASFENWTALELDDWTRTAGAGSSVTKETGAGKFIEPGATSVKMIRLDTDCEFQTTGVIPVDITEPYYLDTHFWSASALECTVEALCYDAAGAATGTVSFTHDVYGGSVFTRHAMYGSDYYIKVTDWPALTTNIKIRISLNANGTVYCDKLWFGSVKYIPDYCADGVTGIRIPGDDILGDLPALCDITLGNPYTSGPWKAQVGGVAVDIFAVSFVDSSVGWAVGFGGIILYTTDGGVTWTLQASGGSTLYGVSAVDANVAWAVGTSGTILYTTNAGATWTAQVSGTTQTLYSVSAVDANVAWAVGVVQTILYTTNAGATWATQASGTQCLYAVSAVNANTAFAAGASGTILYTSDAGLTWIVQSSGTSDNLYGVSAISSSVAFAVGYSGTILRGVYSPGALAITDLILGQRDGYHESYNPVRECPATNVHGDALALAYSPYRRWSSYRVMLAADNDYGIDFLFNLLSHAGNRYMATAGIAFSGDPGANDDATIHLLLQTTDGTSITAQYTEESIDTSMADTKWKEVCLLDPRWGNNKVESHVVSDDASLGNINQCIEIIPNTSLAVNMHIDYVALIPIDCFVRVGTIAANYLILDSTKGYVYDSLDSGPSTAMVHAASTVRGVPQFVADPRGMNLTMMAIRNAASDHRVDMVNVKMSYDPLWLLVGEA